MEEKIAEKLSCLAGRNTFTLFTWIKCLGAVRGRKVSGSGTVSAFLSLMWFCWLYRVWTTTVRCELAGMRITTSKSEAMDVNQKKVGCPLWGSGVKGD